MKKLILSVFATFVLFACSSDDDGGSNNGGDIFITFKVNGTTYNMEPYTSASLQVEIGADQGINASYRAISLLMPTDYELGSHSITDSWDEDAYNASFSQGDITIDAVSGTLVITTINDDFIQGTFNFTGEDEDGMTYNITEGSFKADKL
ncbi:MAG: hypothetical protein Q8K02_13605 [Flavobacterium sp.]|nr:hypothetical protein [Flavobacterium sp.]